MSTSLTRLHDVFDFAMRVGEVMITNGAAAADVTATVLRITASSGIRNVSVQVTLTQVSVSYLADSESTPFTRIRAADSYTLDYAKLDACDAITNAYVRGEVDLHEAMRAIEDVSARGRHYSNLLTTAGWAVMGGACAMYFGAGTLVMLCAALTAGLLSNLIDVLGKWRLPVFYIEIIGAFFCVFMALVVHAIDPEVNSSLVVVACIVMLLAGLTSVGAMQDAITGWYVTAAARLLETVTLTIGVVIGIRGGIMVATAIGADISVTAVLPSNLRSAVVVAVAGAVLGLGYAIGIQVPPRLLPWAVVLPLFSATMSFALGAVGLAHAWAVGITSIVVGFVAVLIAHRVKTPVIILVVAGVVTMVPGSIIYRGLLALGSEDGGGLGFLLTAAQVAIAISAGAILGQFLAAQLLPILVRGAARVPVIASPFSTNRRRRVVTFRRTRRPAPATTAIPVVQLEPGEVDPTLTPDGLDLRGYQGQR